MLIQRLLFSPPFKMQTSHSLASQQEPSRPLPTPSTSRSLPLFASKLELTLHRSLLKGHIPILSPPLSFSAHNNQTITLFHNRTLPSSPSLSLFTTLHVFSIPYEIPATDNLHILFSTTSIFAVVCTLNGINIVSGRRGKCRRQDYIVLPAQPVLDLACLALYVFRLFPLPFCRVLRELMERQCKV